MLVDVVPTLSLAEWDVAAEKLREWGEVVRETADRTVYRVVCADGAVYVKHYHPGSRISALSFVVKRPHRREFVMTRKAASHGIPAALPLLHRQAPRTVESFYVSQGIPETIPLSRICDDWAAPLRPEGAREIISLVDAAADFLARVHAAGLHHDDFHAGNVLLSRPGPTRYALHLIDLASVRFKKRISWNRAVKDLVVWNAQWRDVTSTRMRERFLTTYFHARIEHDPDFAGELEKITGCASAEHPRAARAVSCCLEEIDRRSVVYSRSVDARRDRRAWRTNRDFWSLRRFLGTVHVRADFVDDFKRVIRRQPNEETETRIKTGSRSSVSKLRISTEDGGRFVAFKRYFTGNDRWWKIPLTAFRRTKAARAWHNGNAMVSRRIPTAMPLSFTQPALGPFSFGSILLSQWLEGTVDLHAWLRRLESSEPATRQRSLVDAAETLGRLVGKMHSKGVTHGDLKAANILVRDKDGRVEPFFIDVEGARISKKAGIPLRRQIRDLARLAESAAAYSWIDRSIHLKFLRAYADALSPEKCDWRHLWRQATRRASRRIKQKQTRGVPVL